jgi:3-polyprenyl-4-hydroxybenzoate decarboxylase
MVVGIQCPASMRSCASLCDKLSNELLDRVAAIHLQALSG